MSIANLGSTDFVNATARGTNAAARDALASSTAAPGETANPYAELDSGEFMDLLLTELQNQDPFEPTDTQALMDQVSSLRNIESDLALQESLNNLALSNSLSSAGSMIGKIVTGLDLQNDSISGAVRSVRVVDGKAELELDSGRTLKLERVTEIAEPARPAGGAGAALPLGA